MGKKNILLLLSIYLGCCSALANPQEVSLIDRHTDKGHIGNTCIPTVSSDNDEVIIKSDSILYNVGIVIRDQYGNVMHQSTQTISPNETILYVPQQGEDSQKTTIDLYYDRKHLSGMFEE